MGKIAAGAINAAGSLTGGFIGGNAIGKAGQAIQNGYADAMGNLTSQYGETQGYLQPYADAGRQGLGQLSDFVNNYKSFDGTQLKDDAGYQFRLNQGNQALDRSAASRGQLLSGGQLKSLANYNQGLASQEYNNAFNRYTTENGQRYGQLSGLAGMGLNAAGQQAGYSNQYGGQLSDLILGKANARAAQTMGNAQNWINASNGVFGQLSDLAKNWGTSNGSTGSGSGSGYRLIDASKPWW